MSVHPEEAPETRHVEPDDVPLWIDPQGKYWNDYRPVRVFFDDPEGNTWRLPRRWLAGLPSPSETLQEITHSTGEIPFTEKLHLPTDWDLWEINIPWEIAYRAGGEESIVQVQLSSKEPDKVLWGDSAGQLWRIPHDWRRHIIQLPVADALVAEGVPTEVAESHAGKVVSVNYHPGSLCCMPEHFRFRDEEENRWPVRIQDCVLLGYGDAKIVQT